MADRKSTPEWWRAPWRFCVETITGLVIFAVIAGAAVALNFLIRYLDQLGVDQPILLGLKGAEYALFAMDLVLFGRFLWKTAMRTWDTL